MRTSDLLELGGRMVEILSKRILAARKKSILALSTTSHALNLIGGAKTAKGTVVGALLEASLKFQILILILSRAHRTAVGDRGLSDIT